MKAARISRAVVLAGGKGRRLGALAKDTQKCLLPIGGVPLIELVLSTLWRVGVREFLILTGHLEHQVRTYVAESSWSSTCSLVVGDAHSTAASLAKLRDRLGEPFFFAHGNVLVQPPQLWKILDIWNRKGLSVLGTVPSSHDLTHALVRHEEEQRIRILKACHEAGQDKKPVHRLPNLGFSLGVGIIEPRVLSWRSAMHQGRAMVEELLKVSSEQGMVYGATVDDFVHIETEADYWRCVETVARDGVSSLPMTV